MQARNRLLELKHCTPDHVLDAPLFSTTSLRVFQREYLRHAHPSTLTTPSHVPDSPARELLGRRRTIDGRAPPVSASLPAHLHGSGASGAPAARVAAPAIPPLRRASLPQRRTSADGAGGARTRCGSPPSRAYPAATPADAGPAARPTPAPAPDAARVAAGAGTAGHGIADIFQELWGAVSEATDAPGASASSSSGSGQGSSVRKRAATAAQAMRRGSATRLSTASSASSTASTARPQLPQPGSLSGSRRRGGALTHSADPQRRGGVLTVAGERPAVAVAVQTTRVWR